MLYFHTFGGKSGVLLKRVTPLDGVTWRHSSQVCRPTSYGVALRLRARVRWWFRWIVIFHTIHIPNTSRLALFRVSLSKGSERFPGYQAHLYGTGWYDHMHNQPRWLPRVSVLWFVIFVYPISPRGMLHVLITLHWNSRGSRLRHLYELVWGRQDTLKEQWFLQKLTIIVDHFIMCM